MAAKKLNNLHILALFIFLHGPARAHQARQALIQQRFGEVNELNRDNFGQYFARRGCFTTGCEYAIPGRMQLWRPTGRHERGVPYTGNWQLTAAGMEKAMEALQLLAELCNCRIGSAKPA